MSTKVKFLVSMFFILTLFLIIGGVLSLAKTDASVEATVTYQNLNASDNVSIGIDIKDLEDIGEGINAYILTINFDTNKFEFVKAEGVNGWNNPTYNEKNLKNGKIKFVSTRSDFSKKTGEILKITLKLKDKLTASELNQISFENVSFANKINGSTQKLQIENIKLNVLNSNESSDQAQPQETKKPQQTETNNDKKSDTAKGPLPQAGEKSFAMVGIILIISVLIFYKKYKKIKI